MIPFRRMNGLGNVFAVVDVRGGEPLPDPDRIRALARPDGGIGFDQFIAIAPGSGDAHATMRIFNADGGEVESCGNAARCVVDLLLAETDATTIRLDSAGGAMAGWRSAEGIAIDMGVPRFAARDIPLAPGPHDPQALIVPGFEELGTAACVNVGNPHAVFFVEDVAAVDLARTGARLEVHPIFPERANVSFVTVTARDEAVARVWERGAGATRACGTAACAIVAVGEWLGLLGSEVTVRLPGGSLAIALREKRIVMSGPAALDWTGLITDDGWRREGGPDETALG